MQSSVGIIFKCKMIEGFKFDTLSHLLENEKKIESVQLLMVQRAGFERDINACSFRLTQTILCSLEAKINQQNQTWKHVLGKFKRKSA